MMASNEGLHEDPPPSLKTAALAVGLAFAALFSLAAAAGVVGGMLATHTFWAPWSWQITAILAAAVLVSVVAIWGLLRLKPWKRSDEPVSPATRRTRRLFWLTELVGALAALALIYGTQLVHEQDLPFGVFSHTLADPSLGMFSNRPVSPGIAIFAITSWVLAMAIGLWRYLSADEYERKANDFGKLVAFRLFYTVTPAWWVAARAGLLPQPNAMVLWIVALCVVTVSSFWRQYR
jgi:MFS family permease